MENLINTNLHAQMTHEDLNSNLKLEFGKILHDNKLDILVNASDIGFHDFTGFDIQSPSHEKEGNQRFSEPEISFLKSDQKPEFISQTDMLPFSRGSPEKLENFREDNFRAFCLEPDSPHLFPNRMGIKSKESYFYPQHWSLDQPNFKNFADFDENPNFFEDYENESLDMLWNETLDLPKDKAHYNLSREKIEQALKLSPESFNSEGEEEGTSKINESNKQSPYSKMNDDLEKIFPKKISPVKSAHSGEFPGHCESTIDTHQNLSQNMPKFTRPNTSFMAPSLSRPEHFFEGEAFEDPYYELKGRSSRGLRVLSLRVKEVVAAKKTTSYKEVADYLTLEVTQRMKSCSQGEARDEQNIKRRVYDALNVLIAADILKKDGKIVYCGEDADNIGLFKKRELIIEAHRLRKKKIGAEKKIQKKQRGLQELIFKFLAIHNLIKRNKETHNLVSNNQSITSGNEKETSPQEVQKESQKADSNKINIDSDKIIHFPFIIIPSLSEDSMNVRLNRAKTNALIESKTSLDIFGDTDVLLKLKFHYVAKELFEQVVVKDVHKFIPSTYLENLK